MWNAGITFVCPILKFNHDPEAEIYKLSQVAEQHLKVRFHLDKVCKIRLPKMSEVLCSILENRDSFF